MEACDDLEDKEWVKPDSVRCWLKEFKLWFKDQPAPDQYAMKLPYAGDSNFLQKQFIKWAEETPEG